MGGYIDELGGASARGKKTFGLYVKEEKEKWWRWMKRRRWRWTVRRIP